MSSNDTSGYTPTFTSSGSALRTLRTGKKNPNWKAAAEFLMERAAPDVKLLVEAATQIELEKEGLRTDKREVVIRKKRNFNLKLNFSWMQWLLVAAAGAGFIALLVWIIKNATIRAC
ncbi:hypothetical protein [Marinospirillum insulare]|uniref:Uncharacterized protein n=1 Tax=Marinospirillum insulare TaxID=217169 RepID=A0ABQ5ZWR7_9GAMM|nr:hypothetical protein [Marinospirillum insulare]GLR63091.1 hypothetical protein GCM10007878_05260 [Marinospirillum insulare]